MLKWFGQMDRISEKLTKRIYVSEVDVPEQEGETKLEKEVWSK